MGRAGFKKFEWVTKCIFETLEVLKIKGGKHPFIPNLGRPSLAQSRKLFSVHVSFLT